MISGHNDAPAVLRYFSKILCLSTLFLIFAGGMVTSTGSGLSVPDWPLSYGMIFPPMVGGVFYEHGHRMIASVVGFMTLIFMILVLLKEPRIWVRRLSIAALLAVIAQGLLGGLTVLYFLPTPISVSHAILGQTFFVITVMLAFAYMKEWFQVERSGDLWAKKFIRIVCVVIGLMYVQLLLGALMRHTGSGLAIYDFPLHAGYLIPPFNEEMLLTINDWRFAQGYEFVKMPQVVIHFLHRCGALVLVLAFVGMNVWAKKHVKQHENLMTTLYWVNALLCFQVMLGVLTILSAKAPVPTSLHVVTGAALLGMTVFLALRASLHSCSQS